MTKLSILLFFVLFYLGALMGILACYITTDNRPLSFWEYLRYVLRRLEGDAGGLADEEDINATKNKLTLFTNEEKFIKGERQ